MKKEIKDQSDDEDFIVVAAACDIDECRDECRIDFDELSDEDIMILADACDIADCPLVHRS